MMIIIKHRGCLFSTLPRLGGTGLGPRAGVHGGRRGVEKEKEKQKTKEEGQQGDSWGGGNRSNERLEGGKKDKLEEDRGEY